MAEITAEEPAPPPAPDPSPDIYEDLPEAAGDDAYRYAAEAAERAGAAGPVIGSAKSYPAAVPEAEGQSDGMFAEFDAGFADELPDLEEEGFSMKLFTLNSGGDAGILPGENEIPLMGTGTMNKSAALSSDEALTYYYVRTACAHANAFRNSYHDIPNVLIAKVGPALYGSWATKVQNEDLCGVNILSFAVRFGLSAEDIYATGDTWYFLDLPDDIPLTGDNAAAVEQYYLNGGEPGKMIPRLTVYELKTAMIREAGLEAYLGWRDGDTALRGWTVSEGAAELGIPDARLAELYEEAAGKVRAEYGEEFIPSPEEAYRQ